VIPAVALFPVTGGFMAPPEDAAEEDAPLAAEEAEEDAEETTEEAAEVAELTRESMAPVAVEAPTAEEEAASAAAPAGAEEAAASLSAAALNRKRWSFMMTRLERTYGLSWAKTARAGTRAARNNVFAYIVNIIWVGLLFAFSLVCCSVKERLKRRKQVSHSHPLYIG